MYFIKRIPFWAKKLAYFVFEFTKSRHRFDIAVQKIPVADTRGGSRKKIDSG